eukprot:7067309-Prymnesium_polylepis.4
MGDVGRSGSDKFTVHAELRFRCVHRYGFIRLGLLAGSGSVRVRGQHGQRSTVRCEPTLPEPISRPGSVQSCPKPNLPEPDYGFTRPCAL